MIEISLGKYDNFNGFSDNTKSSIYAAYGGWADRINIQDLRSNYLSMAKETIAAVDEMIGVGNKIISVKNDRFEIKIL